MSAQTKEGEIQLALSAMKKSKKLNPFKASKIYGVPYVTLLDRKNGKTPIGKTVPKSKKLSSTEEEVIVNHILDLDARGFPPRPSDVEDMANHLLAARHQQHVGKLWAHRFVKRVPELKTRFSRSYDFQRALCEDPKQLEDWFRLVTNMRAKYGVADADLWNFDETGFMMGVICGNMVVTRADRKGKCKKIQPGNREWATAIIGVSAEGQSIPPFLVVQGSYHLANWYTEGNLPPTWAVKPTSNGWTNNETGLEWLRHFNQHTAGLAKGAYRMLILDGHESHLSAGFNLYCDSHKIITLCLPAHSSHLTQPLDVGCFSVLKRFYGCEINEFIKAHITHITKVEFFLAFQEAYKRSITEVNIKSGFRGAGLVPVDPQAVISKLDVRLRTPSQSSSPPDTANNWVSQTPHNPLEALSQTQFVRKKILAHQGSSPTPIFHAVNHMAKGIETLAHTVTLLNEECKTLRQANSALSKRRRAPKKRLQKGGVLTSQDAEDSMAQKEVDQQVEEEMRQGRFSVQGSRLTMRRCGNCGRTGHNARTCQVDIEIAEEKSSP